LHADPTLLGRAEDRTLTHGYEPTREAAMAAFAKIRRRENLHRAREPRGARPPVTASVRCR
jgi:hypothetical protein